MPTGPVTMGNRLFFRLEENPVFPEHALARFAGKGTVDFELLVSAKQQLSRLDLLNQLGLIDFVMIDHFKASCSMMPMLWR